jgi:CxxC motif-containing protein
VKGGEIERLPVRTDNPIRKASWKQAADLVKELETQAPVGFRDIIQKDFTEDGINLIAARKILKS